MLKCFLSGKNYIDSLKYVLSYGGDTDTNAAIVCGLIGAADGFDKIPTDMKNICLSFDP